MNLLIEKLIYLLSCAVNGNVPDGAVFIGVDYEALFYMARKHSLGACVYVALASGGVVDKRFSETYYNSLRRTVLFDEQREKILSTFEKAGIRYAPLKGVILKELYPEPGMREMADNDILYDGSFQEDVKDIMVAEGFKPLFVGRSNHDVYRKPPVYNFEMHTSLYGKGHKTEFYEYYKDPVSILIKDEGKEYGYHFSDEDFYVYITSHEYKHYSGGGTGLRSLLDCYVYLKAKGDKLDFEYIEGECRKLGIEEFERRRRQISLKVFTEGSSEGLDEEEQEMFGYYAGSGTYGNIRNRVSNRIEEDYRKTGKRSKSRYVRNRLFPSLDYMSMAVPFVNHNPLLYPAGFIVRVWRSVFKSGNRIKREVEAVRKYDKR